MSCAWLALLHVTQRTWPLDTAPSSEDGARMAAHASRCKEGSAGQCLEDWHLPTQPSVPTGSFTLMFNVKTE